MIPNSQMMTVLQTSARDLETGEITLETVAAMGTEIPIDTISPIFRSKRRVLAVT